MILIIYFGLAFKNAWERMIQILFRPFSFEKWLGIGLSAFLAGLLVGGNGLSSFSFLNTPDLNHNKQNSTYVQPVPALTIPVAGGSSFFQSVDDNEAISNFFTNAVKTLGWAAVILILVGFMILVFLFQILFAWLGSRGQFMFLDNIVRNRSAIAGPWNQYAVQAHSLFKLILIYIACVVALIIVFGIALFVLVMLLGPAISASNQLAVPAIAGLAVLGVIFILVLIPASFIIFNYVEFGLPIMFCRGTLAIPAFHLVLGLIKNHLLFLLIYALLRFAMWIGVVICCLLLCCVCCIGVIPYVGSVALLPALVFVRVFSLEVLAQLNPEYNVWAVEGAVNLLPPRG